MNRSDPNYRQNIALLKALESHPLSFASELRYLALAGADYSEQEVRWFLDMLAQENLVYNRSMGLGKPVVWCITKSGALLLQDQDKSDPAAKPEASESSFGPEAHLVVDAEELDAWWRDLDVECKADAFMGFALRSQRNSWIDVYCDQAAAAEHESIPVLGSIPSTAEATHSATGATGEAVQQ